MKHDTIFSNTKYVTIFTVPCFIEYVNDRFLQYIGSLLLNYAAVSVSILIKSGIGQ